MRRMIGVVVWLSCWAACAPVADDDVLDDEVDEAQDVGDVDLTGSSSSLLWGPEKYILTIDVVGGGYVTFTKPPDKARYECRETRCRSKPGANRRVLLRAVGANFLGWSGACAGTSTCDVTVGPKGVFVTANFAPN